MLVNPSAIVSCTPRSRAKTSVPQQQPSVPVIAMDEETRKANDGQYYTWDQFVEYYPNDTNWYWDQAGGAPAIAAAIPDDGKSLKRCSVPSPQQRSDSEGKTRRGRQRERGKQQRC